MVSVLNKAIRMSSRRLYLGMLLLVIGCQSQTVGSVGQDNPALPTDEAGQTKTIAEAELDKELKIYKSTLLEGKNEQIRIDSATVMLFNENPLARKIILDTLKQTENSAARVAVCKALIQTRAWLEPVKNKEDFIQPLLDILTTCDFTTAKLAAEATLTFEYQQISEPLEKLIEDSLLPVQARLNAIYALELHPDMRVAIKLIKLLDDPEKQVANAAERALLSMGIPTGKDPEFRKQAIEQLQRKGPEGFLRDWLIRQREQIREMKIEMNLWQGLYLVALGKMYDGISDDAAKGSFLAEYLQSPNAVVRLWALKKVYQWRVASGKSKWPPEFGPILVNLVSDQARDVRLETAKLLPLMGELNSAQPLLAQLEVEQDDDIKMALFEALGYAFLPNPKNKIPSETRKQALELAVKYLAEQEPKKAKRGADVMKKLLEQNELTSAEVDRYLGLLVERYQNSNNDGTLCGELLSTMAGMCAPQSFYNAQSKKRFGPLFEQALSDKTNLVREAAVDGLLYIDKTRSLESLRKDFTNDPSVIIRKKLIDLAGEVGGKEDLLWLAEKIVSTAESEPAWQAMLKIFKRSEADVLYEWIAKLDAESTKTKLSDEQRISFLEIAEQKAVGENKPEMLRNVREKLVNLYMKIGQFERAADYLGILHETAQDANEKEAILPDLLDAYLRWPKVRIAAKLVENCLLEKDLDINNVIIRSIDNYLSNPPVGADPNTVLKALLAEIKTTESRPKWDEQKKRWTDRLGKAKDPDKPKKGDN